MMIGIQSERAHTFDIPILFDAFLDMYLTRSVPLTFQKKGWYAWRVRKQKLYIRKIMNVEFEKL